MGHKELGFVWANQLTAWVVGVQLAYGNILQRFPPRGTLDEPHTRHISLFSPY